MLLQRNRFSTNTVTFGAAVAAIDDRPHNLHTAHLLEAFVWVSVTRHPA